MEYRVPLTIVLVIAGVLIAGCTQSQSTTATPTIVPVTSAPAVTAVQQPSFSLGQEYLHKKYSFDSEKVNFTEQFHVTNDPWAIDFTVNPHVEDYQYTWFEITATNLDTGDSDTYGYGRIYPLDKHQQLPMYHEGPYRFDMKGNRVSVDVIIAKRNP
jgi:hypothetical protein